MKYLKIVMMSLVMYSGMVQTAAPNLDQALNSILEKDDSNLLKSFITTNPTFDWTSSRTGIPKWLSPSIGGTVSTVAEAATPLIAATVYGAVNCLKYLINNNIGNIQSSIYTTSSHGYTALQYAKNPRQKTKLAQQSATIINILTTLLLINTISNDMLNNSNNFAQFITQNPNFDWTTPRALLLINGRQNSPINYAAYMYSYQASPANSAALQSLASSFYNITYVKNKNDNMFMLWCFQDKVNITPINPSLFPN